MIDKAIISLLNSSCDVTFMKGMPFGTDKEIGSSNTIKTIMETASNHDNTEYLEYYLENDRNFNINYIDSGYVFNPKLRMTLDSTLMRRRGIPSHISPHGQRRATRQRRIRRHFQ